MDPATLPRSHQQVQALSVVETHRRRVLAEASHLARWLEVHPEPAALLTLRPSEVALQHLQQRLAAAMTRSSRPVTRPTTPATWAERLCAAFPSHLRLSAFDRWIKGLQAMAPAPPQLLRDVDDQLRAAINHCHDNVLRHPRRPDDCRLWIALWLSLSTTLRGFRPLPALRAPMPQATRTLRERPLPALPILEVEVVLDKDNPVGAIPAPRVRDIPVPRVLLPALALLPYPNDRQAVRRLAQTRSDVARQHGVTDLRAGRRDAGKRAEREGVAPHLVLNHAPGSRHDATYVGSLTGTRVRSALAAW